ncbi:MAG TPA: PQQ-dependent dehydrogenase, methanol/ethanol family [Bryobacteraceae bacterium]|nr:PQQ-dependent dehydrogenase, methanol/ethanol family [Bryobacteraceae bacterium]
MKPRKRCAVPALLILLAVGAPAARAAESGATGQDWPSYGGTALAWRYSGLDQVNTGNVKSLVPVWAFQTGDYADGLEATPIVVDGVMYISTASSWVIALDAAAGKLIWEYRYPGSNVRTSYGRQSRGVAVGQGHVLVGTFDNHLIALDQKTGRELWNVDVEPAKYCGCSITGAPLVVKDKVIAGVTGGDAAHRGYLSAFDIQTGRLKWRFYTIPGPGKPGHDTWPGDSWKFGGGSTWMTGSYDADLDLLYWGIGNASADFDSSRRQGANLYTASIVALNPDTGKLVWYNQLIPRDVWDFDAVFELILADLPWQGQQRKLLFQFNKSGYLWVLDRTNGKFLDAWPFVENSNWIKSVASTGELVGRNEPELGKTKLMCPSLMGGKSWNQASYSPQTGLMYVAAMEICADLTAQTEDVEPGASAFGGTFVMKPPPDGPSRGFLAAIDPQTGKRVWKHDEKYFLLASVLSTAGGLVFCGNPQGEFFALDARTGEELWSFQTGGGNRGSSVSYAVNGRQYIATPSGWGSLVGGAFGAAWPDAPLPRGGSSIFVFALPESSK